MFRWSASSCSCEVLRRTSAVSGECCATVLSARRRASRSEVQHPAPRPAAPPTRPPPTCTHSLFLASEESSIYTLISIVSESNSNVTPLYRDSFGFFKHYIICACPSPTSVRPLPYQSIENQTANHRRNPYFIS